MKRPPTTNHPIRRWREANGVSPEQFALLISKHGGQLTSRSLGEIESGRRRPSFKLAKVIEKITKKPWHLLLEWKRGAA